MDSEKEDRSKRFMWGDDDLQIIHRNDFNVAEHFKVPDKKEAEKEDDMVPIAELDEDEDEVR
jgi:hypothetical protein